MDVKLSYEDWRKKITINVPESASKDLKELHGLDILEELEKIMKYDYEVYLCGGFEAVVDNRKVLNMQCDPTIDTATIPSLWPTQTK